LDAATNVSAVDFTFFEHVHFEGVSLKVTKIIASEKTNAPSLDELLVSDDPAWLWDGERTRIVWANPAGTAWFGAETLFDLLEIVFDEDEAAVERIKHLTTRLPRGKQASLQLKFTSAASHEALACTCYVHTLADGRSGLLVCTNPVSQSAEALPAAVQAMALGAFPLPVCVLSGSGDVQFSNEALLALLPGDAGDDFIINLTDDLIEKSLKSGLTSGLKTIETRYGQRDLRIIARPLEKADRLADSSFLLVLEDVTERRSLERSLLEAADARLDEEETHEPEPQTIELELSAQKDTEPSARQAAPSELQLDNEVVRALTALRREIEKQTRQAESSARSSESKAPVVEEKSQAGKPAASSEENVSTDISVPDIVSSTLNSLPQPLVLVDENGTLLFANNITTDLMGVETWQEISQRTTLGDALAALEGEDGTISLFTAKDEPLSLDVIMSTFPWKDGPVYQATLSPGSDGEEADNRRAIGSKKNSEKLTAETTTEDLSAKRDNVVSLHQEKPASTDRPATEETPRRGPSDDELRAILDTATDGIITLDSDGNICSFSAGAEALFGLHSADVDGKAFSDLLDGDSKKVVADYLDALGGSGLAAVFNDGREVQANVGQGGLISLFLTIGRLDKGHDKTEVVEEGTAVFCVVVRDITQWKKTESELRQSKELAEKSNAQKSLFLANISHELRTPLNAIMGFSEVMRSERFGEIENEKYLAYANDIHASGGHLLTLINDLLDLAKIESGKLELNFTSVNLLNIIDEAIHLLSEDATGSRILLRKSAAGNLPNVVADMRSMKQILLNLLSNSVKFSKPGGQIIVAAKLEDNGELVVTVKDTGRGMNEEELQRALTPFQQVENHSDKDSKDRTHMGTGLGLPLTKALVEANRARFSITSAPKKGTQVKIIFPTTRVLAD